MCNRCNNFIEIFYYFFENKYTNYAQTMKIKYTVKGLIDRPSNYSPYRLA